MSDQLLCDENARYHTDYYENHSKINDLILGAGEGIPQSEFHYITEIQLAVMGRFFSVMRHAFYTGYKYALYTADAVRDDKCRVVEGKLREIEEELGFSQKKEAPPKKE